MLRYIVPGDRPLAGFYAPPRNHGEASLAALRPPFPSLAVPFSNTAAPTQRRKLAAIRFAVAECKSVPGLSA